MARGSVNFGLAATLLLASCPLFGSQAQGAINAFLFFTNSSCQVSDALALGSDTPVQLCEAPGEPGSSISDSAVILTTTNPQESISFASHTIALTEPGTQLISDLVTANLSQSTNGLTLTVALTSDDETPLTGAFDLSIPETGAVQDLTTSFENLLDPNRLLPAFPTIEVASDVELPEPASLALLATGLLGLAIKRRRKR